MSLKDTDDIYLYLSSLAGGTAYPKNTTTDFENRILPIHLDPNRDYEVGLCNILFPKYFYCIMEGDPNSSISFHGRLSFYGRSRHSNFSISEYNLYTYLPERNLVSNFADKNIAAISKAINGQMVRELQTILNESYEVYFPHSEIIYYDQDLARVVVNNAIVSPNSNLVYTDISIKFASHIACILGFDSSIRYTVYMQRFGEESSTPSSLPVKLFVQYIPRADAGNDYMYVYSDIISPSRFGNQIVNILDVIPLPGDASSKGANPITYKPVALSSIQSVAIKITNQRGKPINFEDGGNSVTCVLHIRPR